MKSDATRGRPTYAMRLGRGERRLLEAAAIEADLPLSTYIRERVLEVARRELTGDGEGREDA